MEGTTVQRPHVSAALACSALLLAPLLAACGGTAEADTQPPGTPRGVTAQASSSTSVHVMWKAATDNEKVAGYEVYRGKTKVKSVPATKTMIDVNGLTASTDYTFSVRTKDTAGNLSEPSKAVPVTTQDTPPRDDEPPTTPTKLTGRAEGAGPPPSPGARRRTTSASPRTTSTRRTPGSTACPAPRPRPGSPVCARGPSTPSPSGPATPPTSPRPTATRSTSPPSPPPGAPASTAPTGLRPEVTEKDGRYVLDLSWDQPETGGSIPAYELYLNGKLTTTIVWGGTPPTGRATYRLDLADPA